jgi:hypothetical protein
MVFNRVSDFNAQQLLLALMMVLQQFGNLSMLT